MDKKKTQVSVLFMLFSILFCVCLIAANVLETKQIAFGPVSLTGGLIVFPVSYIINDVVCEVWGYQKASHVRAGRANVAILDGVRVNSYGSMVPLNQVATVTTPDARTIAIRPWDKKAIKDIEKAIMDSGVGITPENNGEIVRLGIPQPTGERRKELVKQCNKIAERAKIEVRNVRQEIKDKLKKAIKDGLSEDLEKDAENDLQKLHDKYIKQLENLMDEKEKEIMTV